MELKGVIQTLFPYSAVIQQVQIDDRGDHFVISLGNFRFISAPQAQIVSLTESEVENV